MEGLHGKVAVVTGRHARLEGRARAALRRARLRGHRHRRSGRGRGLRPGRSAIAVGRANAYNRLGILDPHGGTPAVAGDVGSRGLAVEVTDQRPARGGAES
jgi:hypothetical protein